MPEGVQGRDREIQAALDLFGKMQNGPAALIYEGDLGIGKTTLWRAALDRADEFPIRAISTAPALAEGHMAFAGLADLLEPVVEEVEDRLPEPQRHAIAVALLREDPGKRRLDQRAVAAGLLSTLRLLARAHPLLIAVDDLQWLDQPSANVLGYALRRLGDLPVGVLACARVGDVSGTDFDVRSVIPQGQLILMRLGPLSLAALHQLLKERMGRSFSRRTLIRIENIAGGNPFFALELARSLGDDALSATPTLPVPDNLRQLVERRIAQLPHATRIALLAAASLRSPTFELVGHATCATPNSLMRALHRAQQAGIVEAQAGSLRFSHPLYPAVVYSSALPAERRLIHRRLAAVVEGLEEQARHSALGVDAAAESQAAMLEVAAEHARARGAPEVAAELAEHARRLTPADDSTATLRRCLRAATYRMHVGELPRARALLAQVLARAPRGLQRADALRLKGEIEYHQRSFVEGIGFLEEALEHAGDDPAMSAEIELHLAYGLNVNSDWSGAETHARRALVLAERAGQPALLAEALAVLAIAEFLTGRGLDRPKIERALEREDLQRQVAVELRPSLIAGCLELYVGELDRAIDIHGRLRERFLSGGEEIDLVYVASQLAWATCWRGDLAAAEAYVEEAVEAAERLDSDSARCIAFGFGALQAAWAGEASLAGIRADWVRSNAPQIGFGIAVLWVQWAMAILELSRENPRGVDEAVGAVTAVVERQGLDEPIRAGFLPEEIEALIALGDLERAEKLTTLLEELGVRHERPWVLVAAARCRALVRAAYGDLDGASRKAEEAVMRCHDLKLRLEVARTLLVAGEIERRRKHKRTAGELLHEALSIFSEGGARLWAEKTRRALDRVGGERRSATELTPSEQRVAELTATGMTNRDVAAALFMSPKTVEANLAHVYSKLGIRSRAELGARMQSAGATHDT
jgi:DNA-binding CsgD family transcriptional regulator